MGLSDRSLLLVLCLVGGALFASLLKLMEGPPTNPAAGVVPDPAVAAVAGPFILLKALLLLLTGILLL